MSTPFALVPRAVARHARKRPDISRPPQSPSNDPTVDDDDDDEATEKAIELNHPKFSTVPEDIAALISLALSDYNIWLDSDLSWKLDACLHDDVSPDDAGFVPINYLLRRPPFRGALTLASGQPDPSEVEVVKALRTHAPRTLEVRMHLPHRSSSLASSSASTTNSSVWSSTGKTARKKDVGGYEVRRRDWTTLRSRPSRGWSRARWDNLTAYMECVPPQYRSIGGIARFADSLFSATKGDTAPCFRVQCVTLPPHYLDQPGDIPKCKGYALVMFSTKSDLETVLDAWPWRRPVTISDDKEPSIVKEAHKYGLRVISKAHWDMLNEEYVAYKQILVEKMALAEQEMRFERQSDPSRVPTQTQIQPTELRMTTPTSYYPFDCLVFVRNVHPGTNKTTLKSLFLQAFRDQDHEGSDSKQRHGSIASLDYVDFNKGTDTCYLRLGSPSHTTRLLAHFTSQPKTQSHGLDAAGRTPLADDKPISMERVQGKKEEVYWEKVPDKVRRQAVERVVQAQRAESESSTQRDRDGGSKWKKRTRSE